VETVDSSDDKDSDNDPLLEDTKDTPQYSILKRSFRMFWRRNTLVLLLAIFMLEFHLGQVLVKLDNSCLTEMQGFQRRVASLPFKSDR
jgi:hypothetical protein